MGTDARGIGARNAWPCVGDPSTWPAAGVWFTCPSEGALSLLAVVPQSALRDDLAPDGALVHMTVCRTHVQGVRAWLRERVIPGEDVDTYGTEFLMREWGQIEDAMEDTPIFRPAAATG